MRVLCEGATGDLALSPRHVRLPTLHKLKCRYASGVASGVRGVRTPLADTLLGGLHPERVNTIFAYEDSATAA